MSLGNGDTTSGLAVTRVGVSAEQSSEERTEWMGFMVRRR